MLMLALNSDYRHLEVSVHRYDTRVRLRHIQIIQLTIRSGFESNLGRDISSSGKITTTLNDLPIWLHEACLDASAFIFIFITQFISDNYDTSSRFLLGSEMIDFELRLDSALRNHCGCRNRESTTNDVYQSAPLSTISHSTRILAKSSPRLRRIMLSCRKCCRDVSIHRRLGCRQAQNCLHSFLRH